jgi:hypothetical protein
MSLEARIAEFTPILHELQAHPHYQYAEIDGFNSINYQMPEGEGWEQYKDPDFSNDGLNVVRFWRRKRDVILSDPLRKNEYLYLIMSKALHEREANPYFEYRTFLHAQTTCPEGDIMTYVRAKLEELCRQAWPWRLDWIINYDRLNTSGWMISPKGITLYVKRPKDPEDKLSIQEEANQAVFNTL